MYESQRTSSARAQQDWRSIIGEVTSGPQALKGRTCSVTPYSTIGIYNYDHAITLLITTA